MIPKVLPPDVFRQVSDYFASCVERESGEEGKRSFLSEALKRKNFLPEYLQKHVDLYRGNTHQREFLLSQPGFIGRLGRYI